MSEMTLKNNTVNNIGAVKEMRDYSKEPFFIKKAEKAAETLKKHPVPEAFAKKRK